MGILETLSLWVSNVLLARFLPAAIILVVGILAIRLLMSIVTRALDKSKLEKAAHSLIQSVIRVVLYLLLGLIVASSLGIDVTGLVAMASVLTLAVSLAVQNALSNVIGGFTLLYTKPFATGDFVEIGGQSGTVEEIGLNYTKLASADNKSIVIPNSIVSAAQIVNYSALGVRRVDITVTAGYDNPIPQVLDALKEAAQVPTALADPAVFAGVGAYGESAISYDLRLWSTADDYWTTLYAVNENIKAVFDAKGIRMTFPHLNVHLDK